MCTPPQDHHPLVLRPPHKVVGSYLCLFCTASHWQMMAVSSSNLWVYCVGCLVSHCTSKPADTFSDHKLLCLSTVPLGESRLSSAVTSSPPPLPINNDSCAIPPTSQLTTPPHQHSLGHNGMLLVTVCSCRYCCLNMHFAKVVTGWTIVVVKEPYIKQDMLFGGRHNICYVALP